MGQIVFYTQHRAGEIADGINKIDEYVSEPSSPGIQVHRNPVHLVRICDNFDRKHKPSYI